MYRLNGTRKCQRSKCYKGKKREKNRNTDQCRENIFYPWASKQEWAFTSWLLRSHLSMAAIDSLLSLDIVSTYVLYSSCFLIQYRSRVPHCHFALQKNSEHGPKYFHWDQSGSAKCCNPSIQSSGCCISFIAIPSTVYKPSLANRF